MDRINMPLLVKSDKLAAHYWRRTIPELVKIGRIDETDEAILTNYCFSYAMAMRLEYDLRENGTTMMTAKGNMMERPESAQCRSAWKEVRACSDRLGLSPTSRKKLEGSNQGDDPFFD